MLIPHLAGVVVEAVDVRGATVQVVVSSRVVPVACIVCGMASSRVHSGYQRRLGDTAIGGRPVLIVLRVRRLFCDNDDCPRRTFVEQVPGLITRHGRRSLVLDRLLQAVALALGGRPGAHLADRLACAVSRMTLLRLIRALPLPELGDVPVVGVDDFAVRRGRRYATVLIDAVTHRPVDVLPDRRADTLAAWLREHPQVHTVCRDGSATYAQAIREGAPAAVQVSDRWHLWHGLAGAVEKTVIAHASCWSSTPDHNDTSGTGSSGTGSPGTGSPGTGSSGSAAESALAVRTRQRHAAVHALLDQGAGLVECARKLGWSLNTVKRYARADDVHQLLRPPRYGRCLVDAHRDLVRQRLAEKVPVTQILAEIRQHGYRGSANLLVRYINQGRADPPRVLPSPRRLVRWIMSKPAGLPGEIRRHLHDLLSRCPQMTTMATRVRQFAAILTGRRGTDLDAWIATTRADALPGFDAYLNGLDKDHDATIAGLTLPYSNGPTEGTVTKIKMLKRQMYGRANLDLLRRRLLLSG